MLSCRLIYSINTSSVYSMRCNLRLAHRGSLGQRQARRRHSCILHHWDHRYLKGISSTTHAHLTLLIAGAAGYGIAFGLIQRSFPAYSLSLGVLDLIVVGPTLATNSLSTGLIAWKAWCALASNPRRLSLTMSLA